MELGNRVALVTGATSGIGQATASRLAEAGAHVMVHGRDPVRTQEIARSLHGTPVVADLATVAGTTRLVDEVLARHPTLDLVIANAGVGWSGPFTHMSAEDLERVLAVDLLAPLRLTRALLPAMVASGRGRVVLMSSIGGKTGVAGEAVYTAAKAGLDAFGESLRLELADANVGVTVVVPAVVRTGFFEGRGRPYDRRLPRAISAEVVAAATVAAIRRDADEVWIPRWLRIAPAIRGLAPRTYRRLSQRYGESVRITPE